MHYCPITYELLDTDHSLYSKRGLKYLSPVLTDLKPLPYSAQEQRSQALARARKLSIQGVQPKLSAVLDEVKQEFVFLDQGGTYILKPASVDWPQLPQNEAISMTLAHLIGIETPVHGLVRSQDDEWTYFVRRFDRQPNNLKKRSIAQSGTMLKFAQEDFAQLSMLHRDTKYDSSVERVVKVIEQFASFPQIEFVKLFKRIIFNFIIGNEDMHLKNYALLQRDDTWELAPAYDFLNTSIVLQHYAEESALPINGRKNKIRYQDLIDYLALQRLRLPLKVVNKILDEFFQKQFLFEEYIERSYLTDVMKEKYIHLMQERYDRLLTKK